MALRGLAYSVRMAAYNVDGVRVTGLASTITATLWADGTAVTLTGTVTEIGSTGVYIIPLTADQTAAYNLCMTAVSSTAGITFDPVYLDTEAGRIDVATSTRLATSGYTTPPTVNDIQSGLAKTSEIPSVVEIQNGLAKTSEIPTPPTVAEIQSGLAKTSEVIEKTQNIAPILANTVSIFNVLTNGILPRMPASGTVSTTADLPTASEVATEIITSISSTFIMPAIYGIKKSLYSMEPGKKRQQMAFLARIQRIYDDSPIVPSFVENITYTCTRYDSCAHSTTPVIIAQNVAVPVSSISETIEQSQYWTADDDGCNFQFQPDQSEAFLFDTAGVYEVEFIFVLRGGGTFTVSYRASVT